MGTVSRAPVNSDQPGEDGRSSLRRPGTTIHFIKPDYELKDMGVDYYTITGDGLEDAYNYGLAKGLEYLWP